MTKENPKVFSDVGDTGGGGRRQQWQALVKLARPVHKALNCRGPHNDIEGTGILEWLDVKCPCMACNACLDDSSDASCEHCEFAVGYLDKNGPCSLGVPCSP